MKYCPQCQEQYGDDFVFCDVDGTPLIADTVSLREGSINGGPVKSTSTPPTAVTALVGILIGIVLSLLGYIAFLTPTLNSNESQSPDRENTATSTASAPITQTVPTSLPSATPTPEESPSPEESEASSEAAPAAAMETPAKLAVNPGPISTGTTTVGEGRTLITMKDGSSVEADAAWEDAEGVWYRRSGLVSFVERAKVEKISDLSSRSNPSETPKP